MPIKRVIQLDDAVGLAFGARFRLFTSPHILRNVARVTRRRGLACGETGPALDGRLMSE
jgi:hypothetical protein